MSDHLLPLRDVIERHGLRADKKLGQNFILDKNVTDKIVRYAGDLTGKTVFEIGPGPGGLTRSLLDSDAEKIIAIEYDPRAVGVIEELSGQVADGRLQVVQADALETDLRRLSGAPRVIVANLPYNIATPLLLGWLAQIHENEAAFDSMILMFQKEVADRIVAKPHSKTYGRLSVMAQWMCDVDCLFDLSPSVFVPPPKITSTVVAFRTKAREKDIPPFALVEEIVAAAFGKRRKMVRSSLKQYVEFFEKAGIDETKRAENLTVEDYIRLAKVLAAARGQNPIAR